MPLDEKLLEGAVRMRDKLIDLRFKLDRWEVGYQHMIRRLHVEGGSMREIADALGMSHQRVHQIVDATAGKGALKESTPEGRKSKRGLLRCSFCARDQAEVPKLIAGPGVAICDSCVDLAVAVLDDGTFHSNDLTALYPADPGAVCDFCGNTTKKRIKIATAHGTNICTDCVDLCSEILVEEGDRPKKK